MYYNEQILLQTENEYQNPRSVGTKSFTLLQIPHLIKKNHPVKLFEHECLRTKKLNLFSSIIISSNVTGSKEIN